MQGNTVKWGTIQLKYLLKTYDANLRVCASSFGELSLISIVFTRNQN